MSKTNNIARTRRALIKLALESLRKQEREAELAPLEVRQFIFEALRKQERERQPRLFPSLPPQTGPLRERAAQQDQPA